jgi:GLPGLI family protein
MKNLTLLLVLLSLSTLTFAQLQLKAPGVKWDETYAFDKCNVLKVEFYAKGNELMKTIDYKTYYQSNGENFSIVSTNSKSNDRSETLIDKKHEVAIQSYKSGDTFMLCNAGGYKMPAEADLKKLEIVPTNETKQILGYNCKRFTYTYKKIFGECWITNEVKLSNDYGIFRAAKMAALHNTLSVGGFVMEMTTEDAKGGKTLMRTISLENKESYTADYKKAEMTTAINKVNYFVF